MAGFRSKSAPVALKKNRLPKITENTRKIFIFRRKNDASTHKNMIEKIIFSYPSIGEL